MDRRRFIKVTTAAGFALGAGPATSVGVAGARSAAVQATTSPDVIVVGAGAFGMWTALNLQRLGARVTVVDAYGAGNSRQTSGGETRGVRTSYGDRPHGRLWTRWAGDAIRKWIEWDEMGRDRLLPKLFFNTGDLILRAETSDYIRNTRSHWDALGTPYESLTADEVAYRWPWIRFKGLAVALYEPAAGVVRARSAIESVARVFEQEGGTIQIGLASFGERSGATLQNIAIDGGISLSAGTIIFACGPWFPKVMPALMGNRIRISMGHVFYFAVPPGDSRFSFPNMPSYGVPGCTGWPALPPDHRGFRVRTGGRPPEDPDTSDRWIPPEAHAGPRQVLADHFPDLVGAAVNETRACHYESSVDGNFIVDHHPDFQNVWLLGGGSAEAFKFGPVLGEYIARRVLAIEDDPDLAAGFRLKDEEFDSRGA
ncbi:MAG: FAD-dependent oxidoreductase [Acidobacteria bacterium]|nr:FAD-dependent oxidoreductase [Acidobacteriota bacterium]